MPIEARIRPQFSGLVNGRTRRALRIATLTPFLFTCFACGSERPPPAGEEGVPPRYLGPAMTTPDAGSSPTPAQLAAYCKLGAPWTVHLPLHFEGEADVGDACCPEYGPRDCPHYACVCADGAAEGCTIGCAQGCSGPKDDPHRCRPLTCSDPLVLCKGLPGLPPPPICTTHGGVVSVRVAHSLAECGVDAGVPPSPQ